MFALAHYCGYATVVSKQCLPTTWRSSISRIDGAARSIALMLLIAWCSWRLFREYRVERESDEDTVGDGRRHWSIWSRVAVVVPFALASLAAIGFNYSAFQLTLNCVFTFTLALILLVLRSDVSLGSRRATTHSLAAVA